MSLFIRNSKPNSLAIIFNLKLWRLNSSTAQSSLKKDDEEEFRVLDIVKKRNVQQKRIIRRPNVQPDRADRMAVDQIWANVWPGPKTFHPSSVPLPLRQGYVPKRQTSPYKKAYKKL